VWRRANTRTVRRLRVTPGVRATSRWCRKLSNPTRPRSLAFRDEASGILAKKRWRRESGDFNVTHCILIRWMDHIRVGRRATRRAGGRLLHLLVLRHRRRTAWRLGKRTNRWLRACVGANVPAGIDTHVRTTPASLLLTERESYGCTCSTLRPLQCPRLRTEPINRPWP
jgi:hypothetical protein